MESEHNRIADMNSLDYWQGYFDCYKNISQHAYRLEEYMKYTDDSPGTFYAKILRGLQTLCSDARSWELKMYEQLEKNYGDKFTADPMGRGTIKEFTGDPVNIYKQNVLVSTHATRNKDEQEREEVYLHSRTVRDMGQHIFLELFCDIEKRSSGVYPTAKCYKLIIFPVDSEVRKDFQAKELRYKVSALFSHLILLPTPINIIPKGEDNERNHDA